MLSERATSQHLRELLTRPSYAPLAKLTRHSGVEVFVVGGAVRDVVLGKTPDDLDFVVRGAAPAKLERWLGHIGRVVLVGKRFGVYKVWPRGQTGAGTSVSVDVALPRLEEPTGRGGYRDVQIAADPHLPIQQDLARRDFTVNALAYNCKTGQLIDPYGGRGDLRARILRAVGNPAKRLEEDYSRMVRAVRLAVQLEAKLDSELARAIREHASKIDQADSEGRLVAWEVIGKELARAFFYDGRRALELLEKTNLLSEVLPEVAKLARITQYVVFHPEGDVLTHTKQALDRLYQLKPKPTLIESISVLLHDVGKAERVQIKDPPDGPRSAIKPVHDPEQFFASGAYDPKRQRVMHIGHAEASVAIARRIFARLGWVRFVGTAGQAEIVHNIRYHLLQDIDKMRPSKAEPILFFPNGRVRWSLLALAQVDPTPEAARPNNRYRLALDRVQTLMAQHLQKAPVATPGLARPLVSGTDLLELGLEAGPQLGDVLASVRDAQLAGRVATRQAALKLARSFAKTAR
ncbi:MAG: hypothetical protein U0517_01900 [Candidatus Andersenbacteria bacterium]